MRLARGGQWWWMGFVEGGQSLFPRLIQSDVGSRRGAIAAIPVPLAPASSPPICKRVYDIISSI